MSVTRFKVVNKSKLYTYEHKISKDRTITNNTKIRLADTLIFSIATYTAETWTEGTKEYPMQAGKDNKPYMYFSNFGHTSRRTRTMESCLEEGKWKTGVPEESRRSDGQAK